MILHGASCLEGPISSQRAWWKQADVEPLYEPEADAGHDADNTPIRHDLVARVRRAIAEGTYDTPEKMDLALQRLIDDLTA